ncbi:MAG: hypothetical protein WAN36_07640, partial [Calditrichia bacterium]
MAEQNTLNSILAKLFLVLVMLLFAGCASMRTQIKQDTVVTAHLRSGSFEAAAERIEFFKTKNRYTKKERVLYFLDKGAVLHYQGLYAGSNNLLEEADHSMENLFTQSISKGAFSMLLNDNALDYSGEVYENLFVNILKAVNYLQLQQFDDAYVEVKRLNDKLNLLDDQYGKMVEQFNNTDTSGIRIENQPVKFYNDALAHYLSYLIFRAEGEIDNARISHEKIRESWQEYPSVYSHNLPGCLLDSAITGQNTLNIMAFTGVAPYKKAIGGRITTYDSLLHIADESGYRENLFIKMPGLKGGYHFKFSFPDLQLPESNVSYVQVVINDSMSYRLE